MGDDEDAPIDKKMALNAVLAAIVQTGTSGEGWGTVPIDGGTPTNVPPPIQVHEFNSGVSPHVEYDFALGPDGKIYGTRDKGKIPKGKVRRLRIKLTRTHEGWVATSDIIDGRTYVRTAVSGGPNSLHDEADAKRIEQVKQDANRKTKAAEKAELDARTRGDDAGVEKAIADQAAAGKEWSKAETQRADRFYKFMPKDATTAVRQSLIKLQIAGLLYEVSKEDAPPAITETPPKTARPSWVLPAAVAAVVAAAIIAALVLAGGSSGTKKVVATTKSPSDGGAAVPSVTPVTPTPRPAAAQITWSNDFTTDPQDPSNPCLITDHVTYKIVNGATFAGQQAVVVLFGLDYKDHPTRTFTVGPDGTFTFDFVSTQCYDAAAGLNNQTGTALVSVNGNKNLIPPTDAVVPH